VRFSIFLFMYYFKKNNAIILYVGVGEPVQDACVVCVVSVCVRVVVCVCWSCSRAATAVSAPLLFCVSGVFVLMSVWGGEC